MAERIAVTIRLSPEARRGWDKVTVAQGVTLTALVEAIGLVFDETGLSLLPAAGMVVARAMAIDAERRERR